MFNKKLSYKIYTGISLALVAILGARTLFLERRVDQVPSLSNRSTLKKYIKRAEINDPDKLVVILMNGFILDNTGGEIYFDDSVIMNRVRNKITEKGWSYMTLGLPCLEPRCVTQFYELSIGLQALDPDLVIFHANSSGLNTDVIGQGLRSSNIPIMVYGTELGLEYSIYVGIDNELMGKRLGVWMANDINQYYKEKPSAVFLHTLKGIKEDPFANGEPRIEAVKAEVIDKVREIPVESNFWSATKTYEILINLDEQPDYIVVPSPTVARGVVRAAKARNWYGKTKILVLGADPWSVDNLRSNIVHAIIPGNFRKQSDKMVEFILNKEFSNPATKFKRTYSGDVITRDNLYEITNEDGSIEY